MEINSLDMSKVRPFSRQIPEIQLKNADYQLRCCGPASWKSSASWTALTAVIVLSAPLFAERQRGVRKDRSPTQLPRVSPLPVCILQIDDDTSIALEDGSSPIGCELTSPVSQEFHPALVKGSSCSLLMERETLKGSMSAETPITLSINPQDLRVQTFTVEKLLEPLIIQVTTLVNCPQNPSNRKKGRSKRARVLLASVEEATWNLLDKGEKIAQEATVLKEELTGALEEVRKESEALKVSAERFADDPCYLPKREAVVQAARALLAAVTRLLVLADMIDVMCLLQHVSAFQRTFESLKNVSNKSDLKKTYQKLGKELENLDYLAFKRQQKHYYAGEKIEKAYKTFIKEKV
ncbi:hypothetical protein E5288_WYG021300 [Bos mutus]|uniref:Catenin alpha-3 n=1 Tax=Bos mutus TaxID=72004 RepID=A0A6B0RK64_9CETA|nr:hypothetical protein [Bos mutus]